MGNIYFGINPAPLVGSGWILQFGGLVGEEVKDKRRWQRLSLIIPVYARGQEENGEEFLEFTTLLDVSAGGALLLTRRSLPPSTQVSLRLLSVPLLETTLEAHLGGSLRAREARVVRVQTSGKHHLSGLESAN